MAPRSSATVRAAPRDDRLQLVAAPLRKQVIGRLREAILAQEYQPGQRLVERELCDRLGVSRTVIREALRHLEAEGLIEIIANHGPVVSSINPDDALALFEIRAAVESLAVKYFTERATPRQKKRLEAALARVEEAHATGRQVQEFRAKDAFYTVLLDGAANAVITAQLHTIHARAQMFRAYAVQAPGRTDQALEELREMVAAISAGDVATAQRTAAEHVRKGGAAVLVSLAERKRATGAPA